MGECLPQEVESQVETVFDGNDLRKTTLQHIRTQSKYIIDGIISAHLDVASSQCKLEASIDVTTKIFDQCIDTIKKQLVIFNLRYDVMRYCRRNSNNYIFGVLTIDFSNPGNVWYEKAMNMRRMGAESLCKPEGLIGTYIENAIKDGEMSTQIPIMKESDYYCIKEVIRYHFKNCRVAYMGSASTSNRGTLRIDWSEEKI